jgi:hypothetical protein
MDPIPQWTPIDPSVTAVGRHVRALRRPADRGLVVALVTASDEGLSQAAIRSLHDQDAPPDLIVYRGDETLDEALDVVLPELSDQDAILVMDDRSTLAPTFLSEATARLGTGIGGVGGVYTQAARLRFLPPLQGRGFALTGTPTLFSVQTLRHVIWAREKGLLPGRRPQLYDVNARTEADNLPHALLDLGYKVASPKGHGLLALAIDSWRDLYRQRFRRIRAEIQNLGIARVAGPTAGAAVLGSLQTTDSLRRQL